MHIMFVLYFYIISGKFEQSKIRKDPHPNYFGFEGLWYDTKGPLGTSVPPVTATQTDLLWTRGYTVFK